MPTYPDPVPALKQQLADAVLTHFGQFGQYALASRLGVDQPRASDLVRGRLGRFSLQQLVRFAARADGEVTISVEWTSQRLWLFPPRPMPQPFAPRVATPWSTPRP